MKYEKQLLGILIVIFIVLTLITSYYGSTDIGDYSDVAKYFAGDYSAKIRSSHSYLWGYLHAPIVELFSSFLIFKITSIIFLFLTALSVFYLSGKNRKALWLMVLSPVAWYMAPWINPIQASSLIFLWTFYFISEYSRDNNLRNLIYSGLLIGLGWAVWDTILYLGVIMLLVFLYDKKLSSSLVFVACILIGLAPRLILDTYLFNFAFFTAIKTFISGWVNVFGGIYQTGFAHSPKTFATIFSFLLAIPLSFWICFKPGIFKAHKKEIIFLCISLLLFLMNPQIRYVLVLAPIIILISSKYLGNKGFKISIYGSILITLFFISPYVIEIFYSSPNSQIYGIEASSVLSDGISLSNADLKEVLIEDLNSISLDFPNQSFLVGNSPDDYQVLAHFYWGSSVKEFVSIQDYELWQKNESILYEKRFEPVPNIAERRQFWIEGGLKKSDNDKTDYKSIEYAIGIGEPVNSPDFVIVKEYKTLVLSKKV